LKLNNKNIIITGASQGLGKEIAKYCLNEGASVSVCARNTTMLHETMKELDMYKKPDRKIWGIAADVAAKDEADEFVKQTMSRFLSIDVLINNAGIHGAKNTLADQDFDLAGWKEAVNVNLFGVLHMCLAVMPYFKKTGHGKIINLSGGGATFPMPGMSAYAASKAALVRLTETMAIELKQYRIDANAVAPGAMNTRLLEDVLVHGKGRVTPEYYEKALKQKESGGTPMSKAAELCVYLASDESNGVTGKLISAVWDDWAHLHENSEVLESDIYTLRRIVAP
jgi:NAD(P)-dependent dehydrogenase (short-subunit alcohol dehydrogenase family)